MKIISVEIHKDEGADPDEEIERLHVELDDGHVYFIDADKIPDLAEIGNQMG
jgi:hypothetical protein